MFVGVYMGYFIDFIDFEDMSLGYDILSLVFEFKFECEYMDDELDFEFEKIEFWELVFRFKINIVFILLNWCELKYIVIEFLELKIWIIDMIFIENDLFVYIES